MYVDEYERNDFLAAYEVHVSDLMISQENLLLQVHVLEAKNEMYYETILKLLSELNKANDRVACLSFWYWKICRKGVCWKTSV